jgi:hypothetical protein
MKDARCRLVLWLPARCNLVLAGTYRKSEITDESQLDVPHEKMNSSNQWSKTDGR